MIIVNAATNYKPCQKILENTTEQLCHVTKKKILFLFFEFLKISRLAYGKVNKLADVEFLVSLTATSLQIVMQSEIYVGTMPRIHLNTVSATK